MSAQLVRGDLEISATCTVTYVDPKQLLACGHPILQAGPVSLPMTTAEVVATLASPLNAFKIVNTGDTIGAFTRIATRRFAACWAQKARMIPVHVTVHGAGKGRSAKLNFEVLDLPSLTPQAVMVALYECAARDQREHRGDQLSPDGQHRSGGLPGVAAGSVGVGRRKCRQRLCSLR